MKNLQILTDNEENDLRDAIGAAIDFRNDTLTEEIYYTADNIRDMARKSDTEIRTIVHENARAVSENIDRLQRLESLLQRLDN